MSVLDIVLIVFAVVMLIYGYRKGLLGAAVSLAGTVVPLLSARIIAPKMAAWLMQQDAISGAVKGFIEKKVVNSLTSNAENGMIKSIIESIEKSSSSLQNTVNGLTSGLGETMLTIICFFIILILCILIFAFVRRAVSKTNKIPVIGAANRLGGLLIGCGLAGIIDILIVAVGYYWMFFSGNAAGLESISRGIISGWIINTFIL